MVHGTFHPSNYTLLPLVSYKIALKREEAEVFMPMTISGPKREKSAKVFLLRTEEESSNARNTVTSMWRRECGEHWAVVCGKKEVKSTPAAKATPRRSGMFMQRRMKKQGKEKVEEKM